MTGRIASLLALVAFALTGCNFEQRYLVPDGGGSYAAAITETTPPFIESEEDGALYIVESRIDFPVRAPRPDEMTALAAMPAPAPFASQPWVVRDDYGAEVDLTVSNLEAVPLMITLTVNGINEFNEYVPNATVVDDELVIDFAQWERTYLLQAGERRTVTVREEELDEIAVDLASVVNVSAVDGSDCGYRANQIVYFMNQSFNDARSMECIPPVVPGLVGVKVGIRVQGGADDGMGGTRAPRAVVEAAVRLRDRRDRVAGATEVPWMLPVPTPFTPLVMEEM
jgi:hypothetical protein